MSSSQELITLQFGNFSNFVGTHYWNFHYKRITEKQRNEETSEYVNKLFRESFTNSSRSRFLPRTIYFDIKTKLHSLKQDGTFTSETWEHMEVGEDENHVDVDGVNCSLHAETPIEKNEFIKEVLEATESQKPSSSSYDLDEKVCSWSDFMTYELQDNSVQLLHDAYNDGEEFSYFGVGSEEYKYLRDDFEDKLHFWAEECDHMEGFQIFSDVNNGYSGLMSKLLEDISDDYERKSKLAFTNWSRDELTDEKDKIYRYINLALTLQSLKEYSSLSVLQSIQTSLVSKTSQTVKIPHLNYKHEKQYHTSAILAAAIDSTTIPLYQFNNSVTLPQICYQVNQGNWFLAGSAFGIPVDKSIVGISLFDQLLQSTNGFYGNNMTSLFPSVTMKRITPTSHFLVLQNTPIGNVVSPETIDSKILQNLGLNRNLFNQHPYSVLEFFNERYYPCENTSAKLCYSSEKLRTATPFPDIIDCYTEGKVQRETDPSVLSSLYTSPHFYDLIAEVVSNVKKVNLHKLHVVEDFGLDKDMLQELLEDLIHIAQSYSRERAFHEMEE